MPLRTTDGVVHVHRMDVAYDPLKRPTMCGLYVSDWRVVSRKTVRDRGLAQCQECLALQIEHELGRTEPPDLIETFMAVTEAAQDLADAFGQFGQRLKKTFGG